MGEDRELDDFGIQQGLIPVQFELRPFAAPFFEANRNPYRE